MATFLRTPTKQVLFGLAAWGLLPLLFACAGHTPHSHDRHSQQGDAQHGQAHHRRPSDVQEYLAHLDRPERDAYQKPDQVVEALDPVPGMAIADLGAGSGYFTRRFLRVLNDTGAVYAIDVEQPMLDYIQASLEGHERASRVQLILTTPDSHGLPARSVDLVFVCNVYHHLGNRAVYFRHAMQVLKPGGRIAVIDFYHDRRSGDVGFPRRHLVARETVIAEMTQAGYTVAKEHLFLERQYFLEFVPADHSRSQ